VAEILRAETSGTGPGPVTQTTFPNDDSPVEPAPGTRPEYTPVADHYRTDIALSVPKLDATTWRLVVDGAVESPLSLALDQLRSEFDPVDHFVTLSCVDNLIGGPLIGTTLWTGAPLRDVLERAKPLADTRFAHIYAEDGFDEQIDIELARGDARIMLAYAWDGQPLPAEHGFPLRVLVPGRYGMKQPKWITRISLLADSIPGYWVSRGWDETAEVRTTSVIDTVATKSLFTRAGKTYVPIGGIAYSGAKGISKVEVQVDDLPWQTVPLREPLSDLTWVIWRYDWPFSAGTHYFAVRCYDGEGRLQVTEEHQSGPNGATGLYKEYRKF
jgi:DMSO/TMAO reductase YedYZ molybdopterin-dependent catalytic subunit